MSEYIEKARKVIDSCKTEEQLEVACKYVDLALQRLQREEIPAVGWHYTDVAHVHSVADGLNILIEEKRDEISSAE